MLATCTTIASSSWPMAVGGDRRNTQKVDSRLSPPNAAPSLDCAPVPPVSVAGDDQSVRLGDTVMLDGSSSSDDNTPSNDLSYAWSFTSLPAGSNATLIDADTAFPNFLADEPGTYIVDLVVTDGDALSDSDQIMISSNNIAPTAIAGDDQLVITGNIVKLDGNMSLDPENDDLTFTWSFTSKPASSETVLGGSVRGLQEFIADVEGLYTVKLEVSDFIGPETSDSVDINVVPAEDFAVITIVDTVDSIDDLSSTEVTNGGNQTAIEKFLIQAAVAVENGDIEEALRKLNRALERTDGCKLRGQADGIGAGRDWITDDPDCTEQLNTFDLITEAIEALTM